MSFFVPVNLERKNLLTKCFYILNIAEKTEEFRKII